MTVYSMEANFKVGDRVEYTGPIQTKFFDFKNGDTGTVIEIAKPEEHDVDQTYVHVRWHGYRQPGSIAFPLSMALAQLRKIEHF